MTDVFISYAHEDHPYVQRMAPALEAEGLTVWWDHTIPPGKTWDEVIASGIAEARCCVVLWSKHSVISDWVKEEATIAKDQHKFIPVQIDNSEPPVGFRRIQAAHLQNWRGSVTDPQWQMLVREIRAVATASRAAGVVSPTRTSRSYQAPAPAPRSGPPPLAIGALAVAALIAVIAVVVAIMPDGAVTPAPPVASAQQQPAAQPQAPAVDPAAAAQAAEVERLRGERDEALRRAEQERVARETETARVERERRAAELRAQAERARQEQEQQASIVGTWRAAGRWSGGGTYDTDWTLRADGTMVSRLGSRGTWQLSGTRFTMTLGDPSDLQAGFIGTRVSANRITGTATNTQDETGTFEMTR